MFNMLAAFWCPSKVNEWHSVNSKKQQDNNDFFLTWEIYPVFSPYDADYTR